MRFLIVVVFLCCLVAFLLFKKSEPQVDLLTDPAGIACLVVKDRCQFNLGNETLTLRFTPEPQIEEQLIVDFRGTGASHIQSVFIEGVNMYMGKIPVVQEKKKEGQWEGWTMLGACSEPDMVWDMVITFEDSTTSRIRFTTTTS